MIARADANCTDRARERWLLRTSGSYDPPRVQRMVKKAGSRELIRGEWFTIGDDGKPIKNGPCPVDPGG